MAKYTGVYSSVTLSATADGSNLANSTYPFYLRGGTSTQRVQISEVYIGGEATSASSVGVMVLGRDSTVAAGTVGGSYQSLTDAAATAPGTTAVFGNTAGTTPPVRSSTGHLLRLSFNAYGGIVRWVASPDQMITVVGSTGSLAEVSLSAFTGTTASTTIVSGHTLFEVV
jgi:hypothetical protein